MLEILEKDYRRCGVSMEEAAALIRENLHYEKEKHTEILPLTEALGRIAAGDMEAKVSQPPFARSPLDGYALKGEDTAGAGRENPVRLRVIDEVSAGGFCKTEVLPGTAVRIMTGAPVPAGADCVIRQEDTDYGEKDAQIFKQIAPGSNVCPAGEDFRQGECLIRKNTKLGPVELGILAAMGYADVPVYKKPRIAVFTTGDELIKPGREISGGQIYNSNLYVLQARLRQLGADPVFAENLTDEPEKAAARIAEVLPRIDLIVTTGGVSVGKKDIMHRVLALLHAEKMFWRVEVKPGAPTIFAIAGNKPVIALSGNPFGALNNLELLVRPALYEMTGNPDCLLRRKKAVLTDEFKKASPGRRYIRGYEEDGNVSLTKRGHASGILSSMQGCNCVVEIPPGNRGLKPGDIVEVIKL